jgi:hypothetical protein
VAPLSGTTGEWKVLALAPRADLRLGAALGLTHDEGRPVSRASGGKRWQLK